MTTPEGSRELPDEICEKRRNRDPRRRGEERRKGGEWHSLFYISVSWIKSVKELRGKSHYYR